jgi:hypothetical protein
MAVDITPQGTEKVWRWVVRYRTGTEWTTLLLPGTQLTHMFNGGRNSPGPDNVAVSAVDRTGNESAIVSAEIGNSTILPALTKPKPRPRVEPRSAAKPKARRPAKRTGRKKKKG